MLTNFIFKDSIEKYMYIFIKYKMLTYVGHIFLVNLKAVLLSSQYFLPSVNKTPVPNVGINLSNLL